MWIVDDDISDVIRMHTHFHLGITAMGVTIRSDFFDGGPIVPDVFPDQTFSACSPCYADTKLSVQLFLLTRRIRRPSPIFVLVGQPSCARGMRASPCGVVC